MQTQCEVLLADIFMYSYETELIQYLIMGMIITEAKAFINLNFRNTDDDMSIHNPNCVNWIPLTYPPKNLK